MKRGTRITLALAVAVAVLLLHSTLAAQHVECSACVTFNGGSNCATASAVDESEALRQAVATAGGTLARGMDASIRCAGTPPERPLCRTR